MAKFEDLPYNVRPDLSPFLTHLTKNTFADDKYLAFDNLVEILKTGVIKGSDSQQGFIKGANKAACFMDIPISSLKYIINAENSCKDNPRYEPYGILLTKKKAYKKGCRPVLYLSNDEIEALEIPPKELWRVVRLENNGDNWINWMHEREWRCKDQLILPSKLQAVFVRSPPMAEKLQKMINKNPDKFKSVPKSIIPVNIMCEGLPYL